MQHEATKVLITQNEAWGFYGTISRAERPDEAWRLAFEAIADATGASPEGVRAFLDSLHGRHFADDVLNESKGAADLAQAVERAVLRWMAWRIVRKTARQTGIPQGQPYLTGFVHDCEIMLEAS
jgi:CRP-like cAMP-binding protein